MKLKRKNRDGSAAGVRRYVALAMAFTVLSWLTAAVVAAGSVTFTYDDAGRLVAADYDNGRFRDFRYDKAGNLLARTAGTAMRGNAYPDETVDLKDAIVTLQVVNHSHPAGVTPRGDVNGDQQLGTAEAVYILQVVAGRN